MIVKMTRYGFLLYHRDVPHFLEHLGELGLVDITLSDLAPTAELSAAIARTEHLTRVVHEMKSIKVEHNADLMQTFDTPDAAVEAYDQAVARIAQSEAAIARAMAVRQEVEKWGDFDPLAIDALAERGLKLRFFETTAKAYRDEWQAEYPIEVVYRDHTNVYFVVVDKVDQPTTLNVEALEVKAPGSSALQKDVEIEQWQSAISSDRVVVASASAYRSSIEAMLGDMLQDIDFEKVKTAGTLEAEGSIKILEGWSPNEDRQAIEAFATSQSVIYTTQDAVAEQNPPIKLKNSFFARLYEPIGSLYLMPRYDELDMTPFFAPFFMLFFGMCFGDAGYGLLFIVLILVVWSKIPKKFKDFAWLGIFLCSAAVVFGTFSGNVFGIELVKVDALAEFREFFLNPNDIFYLSIAIGAVQVLFGQVLRVFNRIKRGGSFLYGLSSIGWVLLFVSSIVAGFSLLGDQFLIGSTAYLVVALVSGALILFFNSPGKNPFINFGKGLYSCYEMATGVVGDLISYVRLFAIGLAGTVIAQVFNELSKGLSGDIPVVSFLVMVVILLIGHGLNIFISALGAFVHPVRLTFVEFYKNAEFEGGSRVFKPFKRKINNNK